jgi:hypothetical protein
MLSMAARLRSAGELVGLDRPDLKNAPLTRRSRWISTPDEMFGAISGSAICCCIIRMNVQRWSTSCGWRRTIRRWDDQADVYRVGRHSPIVET